MFTVNPTRWRILTPTDPDYPRFADPFGTTWQHLAVDVKNEVRVKVLPRRYLLLSADERKEVTVQ